MSQELTNTYSATTSELREESKKYGRISVIAAWLPNKKEMIAPYVFNGYTDAKSMGQVMSC